MVQPVINQPPQNFRVSNTLITTRKAHYPTKTPAGLYIIPGLTRPNMNGVNPNILSSDFNGPDFKARPLKHWRRQLRVYNYNGTQNNYRSATIHIMDQPSNFIFRNSTDCRCDASGGNSFIIQSNKFAPFYRVNQGVVINNNAYLRIPYDATDAQLADPSSNVYEQYTGLYTSKCIACNYQNNTIKSSVLNSQAVYTRYQTYLQGRQYLYAQNISTDKIPGNTYFDAQGQPLYPNNSPTGPQYFEPISYTPPVYKPNVTNCKPTITYKPTNVPFARDGAVPASLLVNARTINSVTANGTSYRSATGAYWANNGLYHGTNFSQNYALKIFPTEFNCNKKCPCAVTLTYSDASYTTVQVYWTNPVCIGACPVVGYRYIYRANGIIDGFGELNVSEGVFTTTITNLPYNSNIILYIIPYNVVCAGPKSNSITFTTLTPSAPGSVNPISLTQVPATTNVTLTWTTPTSVGTPLTSFVINIYDGLGVLINTINVTNTSLTSDTSSGYVSGQNYTFQIYAVNSFAVGPTSTSNILIS